MSFWNDLTPAGRAVVWFLLGVVAAVTVYYFVIYYKPSIEQIDAPESEDVQCIICD